MALPPDVLHALEAHLGHPVPDPAPLVVLSTYLNRLPPGLARAVGTGIPARERTRVPGIRRRRHLHAHPAPTAPTATATSAAPRSSSSAPALPARTAEAAPRPRFLTAEEGRTRWPLLWERLGGDPRALEPTAAQREESAWAESAFVPGRDRFVGRLGQMLAEEEEIREWERAREARIRERQMDAEGEEFDSESDDEMETEPGASANGAGRNGLPPVVSAGSGAPDQPAVVAAFERQLLELFLDGLDTIDYDDIDFAEPPADPIAERDAEEAWFDDEEPQEATPMPPGSEAGVVGGAANGAGAGVDRGAGTNGTAGASALRNGRAAGPPGTGSANGTRDEFATQNGQGDYDY